MARYFDPIETGRAIKRLRQENNYTVEQLAETLNISPQAIYKWQNGEASPSYPVLVSLLDVFHLKNFDRLIIYTVVNDVKDYELEFDCA